ncbi:4Fe-4S dicluster domain-containing protein [Chloroflexota bacterium]
MIVAELPQPIIPNPSWRNKVEGLSGHSVSACYQCEKCTNGCPITFAMDIVPNKLIHAVHLGLKDEVLRSNTIWVCASCETCSTRCPNGIDIAHIMDTLRQMSLREGIKPAQKDIPVFHSAFLSSVKKYGRIHELSMIIDYTFRSEGLSGLLRQASMGLDMFMKGKIKLLPRSLRATRQLRNIFKQMERKG